MLPRVLVQVQPVQTSMTPVSPTGATPHPNASPSLKEATSVSAPWDGRASTARKVCPFMSPFQTKQRIFRILKKDSLYLTDKVFIYIYCMSNNAVFDATVTNVCWY